MGCRSQRLSLAADAPLFIQALVNPLGYEAVFPLLDATIIGDMNQNGTFDLGDIAGFNAIFVGPATASAQAVPEPTTVMLAILAFVGLLAHGHHRRRA